MYDELVLKDMARTAFIDILSTNHSFCLLKSSFISLAALSTEEAMCLGSPISLDELNLVIKSMSPIKSSDPDGIQPVFY